MSDSDRRTMTESRDRAAGSAEELDGLTEQSGDAGGQAAEVMGPVADGAALGQQAIRAALDRDSAADSITSGSDLASEATDFAHGLVDEGEGATAIESIGAAADTVGRVVDGAQRVVDAIRGATSRLELTFECDDVDTAWTAESAELDEGLNRPYKARIELSTEELSAEPPRLLGRSCRLIIDRGELSRRVLGVVTEVCEEETEGRQLRVSVVVEPALATLRQRTDTRIFQDVAVPSILKQVLGDGLEAYQRSFEDRLARTYPLCEYRTQFDESDLDFAHRLMEEEGIVYWFEHEDDVETLVLCDDQSKCVEVETAHDGPLEFTEYEGQVGGHEYVSELRVTSQLRPTRVVTRHHDWTNPSAPIEGETEEEGGEDEEGGPVDGARLGPTREQYEHDWAPLTLTDFSQRYGGNDVDDQVQLRREQQAYDAVLTEGEATAIGLAPGLTFELTGHPRPDHDRRYLVLEVSHRFNRECHSRFTCIPAEVPYRPRRRTAKPRMPGIQTARVTGPSGEEIHTDEHGRIKVQFHWDRQGQNDEHSSCWVQVLQPWAGAGWGFVFIPRIGMEVVITFVNGDADRPMCSGAVYNGENLPPLTLPDEKTRSTIKTNSSLGGDGYNELTFEDAAGEEQIIVHAQKDYNETVENNHSTTVHGSQTNSVDGDHTNTIGQNHTESVGENQTLTVEGDREGTVRGCQTFTVEGGDSIHRVSSASYLLTTNDEVTVRAPNKITLDCGGTSSIIMTPEQIVITAGNGAALELSETARLVANAEGMVFLSENVLASSNAGASVLLTSDVAVAESGNSSSLIMDSSQAVLNSGGGSMLTLDADANLVSNGGSSVVLNDDAVVRSSGRSSVQLTGNAIVQSANGAGRIAIEGPVVKLNP